MSTIRIGLDDGDRVVEIVTPVKVKTVQSQCPGCEDLYAYWVEGSDGKAIQDGCNGLYEGDEQEIMAFALNELAALRETVGKLRERCIELEHAIEPVVEENLKGGDETNDDIDQELLLDQLIPNLSDVFYGRRLLIHDKRDDWLKSTNPAVQAEIEKAKRQGE